MIKTPICPDRLRRITGSFSWIDHHLLSGGFLMSMSCQEIALYFFLILAGDKNGLSFYSSEKICDLIKIDAEQFYLALNQLIRKSLIAEKCGLYQVLQLPQQSMLVEALSSTPCWRPIRERGYCSEAKSIARIFGQLK